MSKFKRFILLLCLSQYPLWGWSAESRVCESDCVEVGSWSFSLGLGLGARTNPIESKENTPLILLPEVSYYGKRFFLKNLELGFTLWENPKHQFNFLVTPSYDQRHFNRWDINNFTESGPSSSSISGSSSLVSIRPNGDGGLTHKPPSENNKEPTNVNNGNDEPNKNVDGTNSNISSIPNNPELSSSGATGGNSGIGTIDDPTKVDDKNEENVDSTNNQSQETILFDLNNRRLAALAGVEYMYSTHRFNFHAQSILDVSRVHKGHELRFAAIIPVEFEKNQWALTLGVNYQSQKVLDYYYGVDTDEVADDAFQYTAKSAGVTPMLRLDWQRPVGRHWSWRAVLQYSKLPDAVVASPIIDESFVGTIFVGGVYHF